MAGPEQGDRRARDARLAQKTILDAAEVVFAQHGFDGARIETIAKAAGYNVSLLFQYFESKLGLYTAVLERAYRETTALQAQALAPLPADMTMLSQFQAFRTFLEAVVHVTFDYLVEHPRLLRMLTWEMAEGWQTYSQIAAHFPPDENDHQLESLFKRAWRVGWLRSDFSPLIQLALVFQICQSYLAFLPLYQVMLPGEEVFSQRALSRARQHLVQFIVAGMMSDLPQAIEKEEEDEQIG